MRRWPLLLLIAGCTRTPAVAPAVGPARDAPRPGPIVSAGYLHHCVLDPDGTARCDGGNQLDQLRVPKDRLTAISAGLYHSCGLTTAGTPLCWGSDRGPYPGNATSDLPAPPDVRLVAIAAGSEYTCGLDAAGALVCWGNRGWASAPPPGRFVALSAGYDHACAVRADGEVTCFGEAGVERLPCEQLESVPEGACRAGDTIPKGWTPAPAGLRAVAVAAGASHTCAVTKAATVVCWGADGWGDGNTIWAGQTRVPPSLIDVVEVSAGGGHSCARRRDGRVVCWGDVPSPAGRFVQIDSGANYACGVSAAGAVVCSATTASNGALVSFPANPVWAP